MIVSKKKKPTDGLLPRTEAWRTSCSEYKARVFKSVMVDKPHQGMDAQPVRMVPEMRVKILDKIAADAAANQDRQRKAAGSRRKNNPTRKLIVSALKSGAGPAEQYERYRALAGDDHVNYRSFKEVRLDILKGK